MSAYALLLRTKSYTPPVQWREVDAVGLRDNTVALGRTRYTAGETVLAQADSEIGALHVDSAKRVRVYRADATGDSSEATRLAKTARVGVVHHYDDFTGDPSATVSVEGDLYVRDSGGASAWLEEYDGSTYRGLGVLAENRTTATSGSGARQSSDLVKLRAQLYTGGQARNRDAWLQVVPDVEDGTEYTKIHLWWRREEDGSDLDILTIFQNRSWNSGNRDSSTLELRDTEVASGPAIVDSFACAYRSQPGFAAGVSVTRHNYFDAMNLALGSGATVGDACLVRFNAAAGTHKAVDAGTGNVEAWVKNNVNDVVVYSPQYATKDETPKLAHASITVFDGSATQTLASASTWYQLEGFDTDGLEYNATANAASNQIDITQSGLYQVHFTGALRGDANEVYLFRVIIYTDNPSNPSIDPSLGAAIGLDATIVGGTVAIHGVVELSSGDSVAIEVFNPINPGSTITPSYMQLSVVRCG